MRSTAPGDVIVMKDEGPARNRRGSGAADLSVVVPPDIEGMEMPVQFSALGNVARSCLTVSVILATAGCRTASSDPFAAPAPCQSPDVTTSAWELVDAGTFTFRIPPGYSRVPIQGIDSFVRVYRDASGDAEVSFDLGWYANDLSFDPEHHSAYAECTELIGSRHARIVSAVLRGSSSEPARLLAAASWRNVSDAPTPMHLTMWNTARDSSDLRLLRAVLRTVEFR